MSDVPDLQARLRAALERGAPITVHGQSVVYVDTAGLQLLASFFQSAKASSVDTMWGQVSTELRHAAEISGLTQALALDPEHG